MTQRPASLAYAFLSATCLALLAPNLWASSVGQVMRSKGKIMVLKGGSSEKKEFLMLSKPPEFGDKLEGLEGSALHLKLADQEIALTGPFNITLEPHPKKAGLASIRLLMGKLRMLVKAKLPSESAPIVKTPTATMGVRGTDFFASYYPLLDESEVICFDHEIEFAASNGTTKAFVKAGHWGGLGGRFGKEIAEPMKLPRNVLDYFKALVPLSDKEIKAWKKVEKSY